VVVVVMMGVDVAHQVVVVLQGIFSAAAAAAAAAVSGLREQQTVLFTVEVVVPQAELVPGHQLLVTDDAGEAFGVEDAVFGAHNKIRLPERAQTLVTLTAEQPEEKKYMDFLKRF